MPESRSLRLVVDVMTESPLVTSSSSSDGGRGQRDGGDSSGSQAAFTAADADRLHAPCPVESHSSRAVDIASLDTTLPTYIAAEPLTATPVDDDVKRAASRDRTKQHPVVGSRSSSSWIDDMRMTAVSDDRPCTSVRTACTDAALSSKNLEDAVSNMDVERLYELVDRHCELEGR